MLTLAETRTGYHCLPRLHLEPEASTGKLQLAPHRSDSLALSAVFKQRLADFCVDEILPADFAASGAGEHLWMRVQKQDRNTHDVIDSLARCCGCRARDIGYSGLKDRRAVTTQWFSLPTAQINDRQIARHAIAEIPARLSADPQFAAGCELLDQFMHTRKLKSGMHSGNRFRVTLRECDARHRERFEARLQQIRQQGFPNYFGLQRFGIEGRNLLTYQRLGSAQPGRKSQQARRARSMALSAARSIMFNAVLACRLNDKSCMHVQTGEPLMLANSGSFFIAESTDDALSERLASYDVLTTGPLWGVTKEQDSALLDWQLRETALWLDWSTRCLPEETRVNPELLLQSGLSHQRRSLLCRPGQLSWQWQDSATLTLEFTLPAGVFATALLHELCEVAQ